MKNSNINSRETLFKEYVKNGKINTAIEKSMQKRHMLTPEWKNQVKQAINSNGRLTPKSGLDKSINPQDIVNKYAGTGSIDFARDGKTANEFVKLPFEVGVTFDKKTQRYIKTHKLQIKYTDNGVIKMIDLNLNRNIDRLEGKKAKVFFKDGSMFEGEAGTMCVGTDSNGEDVDGVRFKTNSGHGYVLIEDEIDKIEILK